MYGSEKVNKDHISVTVLNLLDPFCSVVVMYTEIKL